MYLSIGGTINANYGYFSVFVFSFVFAEENLDTEGISFQWSQKINEYNCRQIMLNAIKN